MLHDLLYAMSPSILNSKDLQVVLVFVVQVGHSISVMLNTGSSLITSAIRVTGA